MTSETTGSNRLPLDGVRVLDLGMFWAGPYAGKFLADAGAEVIKIESCSHPDNLRVLARGLYPAGVAGEHPWNRSGMINERNRNKRGVTIEMSTEEGRTLFKRLVAISDVIIENFSNRVMKNWGLDYENLSLINPRIILASIYSQGGQGPESSYVSFGGTLEQLAGLGYVTGYPDEIPGVSSVQLPDPLGGTMAAGLIIAALRLRKLTGKGTHIDLSQRENAVSIIGELLVDYSMNGRIPERNGNRDNIRAPQGCYECQGEDEWITVSVGDDVQFEALCTAMDQPQLTRDPRFQNVLARHQNHDALDSIITQWSSNRSKIDAMNELQRHGVPAGAVYKANDLYEDPHLRARQFWEQVEDVEAGQHLYPGRAYRMSKSNISTRSPSPTLGQDNAYVLGELVGLSNEDLANLATNGVIGTEPTQAARRGSL